MGKEFRPHPARWRGWKPNTGRIVSPLPHLDSLAVLEKLRLFEPQSMRGQPPLVWNVPRTSSFMTSMGTDGWIGAPVCW